MKRFFIISLSMLFVLPAFAELTVDDTTNHDYLINHGHSEGISNIVSKEIAEVNGEPLVLSEEKAYYKKPAVNFIRKVFIYLDPSLDSKQFMNDYQIKFTPHYDEL